MELTKKQIEAIKPKTTEELLSDFYFLVFSPNPTKNIVHVLVDDGTIKLWINIDKFIKIVSLIMGSQITGVLKSACTTYGCFFMVDRCNNDVKKLNIKSEENIINIKQLHQDIEDAKKANKKDQALCEQFLTAIQSPIKERLTKQTGNATFINGQNSTIVYGMQNNFGGYKPY